MPSRAIGRHYNLSARKIQIERLYSCVLKTPVPLVKMVHVLGDFPGYWVCLCRVTSCRGISTKFDTRKDFPHLANSDIRRCESGTWVHCRVFFVQSCGAVHLHSRLKRMDPGLVCHSIRRAPVITSMHLQTKIDPAYISRFLEFH